MSRFPLIFASLLLILTIGGAAGPLQMAEAAIPTPIRVRIVHDQTKIQLILQGSYRLHWPSNRLGPAHWATYPKNWQGTFQAVNGRLILDGRILASGLATWIPQGSDTVTVNGRRYRGQVTLIVDPPGKIIAVNTLPVEEYLNGIMRDEVNPWWPVEAIKAQAVVARTYAYYQIQQNRSRPYDLTGDTNSQVYGGIAGEAWRSTQAVKHTTGEVLTYQGMIFPAYYHSTCGGHTQDADRLWQINLPVLKGKPCGWCAGTKHFFWTRQILADLFMKKLRWRRYDVGPIHQIIPSPPDASGRSEEITLLHDKGTLIIKTKTLRAIFGPDLIRSSRLAVKIENGDVTWEGTGWGHGVGLCQWGGWQMAMQNNDYRKILATYYTGSELQPIHAL